MEEALWSTEDRLRLVIESHTMSEREFTGELERRISEVESRKPDFNALPAFVLLAPLIVPDAIRRNPKQEEWQKRFDPRKIKLGMAKGDVAGVCGKPKFITTEGNAETHAYGPPELLFRDTTRVYLGPINKRYWVAVVFEGGNATHILSNDLFNDEEIVHTDNEFREK